MKREFDVLIERDSEGYYVATVPALHDCKLEQANWPPGLPRDAPWPRRVTA